MYQLQISFHLFLCLTASEAISLKENISRTPGAQTSSILPACLLIHVTKMLAGYFSLLYLHVAAYCWILFIVLRSSTKRFLRFTPLKGPNNRPGHSGGFR